MANTKTFIRTQLSNGPISVATWTMDQNGNGDPFECGGMADKSIQLALGSATGTVVIQGSNDGTNWHTLTDVDAAAISLTSSAIKQIREITRYIRPSLSSVSGSGALTVIVVAS